jgi:hypothetical protein
MFPPNGPDQPGDILGDQPADGPAGVHADYDLAIRVEHEPGGLQVDRVRVDERPGQLRDGAHVGAEADREGQAELVDERGGGRLVVDRQGSDPDAGVG